jgi:hypothetical protein
MVSKRTSVRLLEHVASTIAVQEQEVFRSSQAFERRTIAERSHVVRLAAWLLIDPVRLEQAWKAGAVRYSDLARDLMKPPTWYVTTIHSLNIRN